ncbi:hypothetical protein I4U23_014504 [Adineta vaga]|nr:hypothetical protein I4U23_014504 [Adineta vaga]
MHRNVSNESLFNWNNYPTNFFLEIFAYLTSIDVVYSFSQLNNRFRHLLINYVNNFDFESVSKVKFDYVTQHHDIHSWRSLRLSNDDKTPGQIKLFCQLYPPPRYLSQLQILSLLNMHHNFNKETFFQSGSFDQLVSLTISDICGEHMPVFQLPSLQQLTVVGCKHTCWLMNFHRLKNLKYTVKSRCIHLEALKFPTTLNKLSLVYDVDDGENEIQTALQNLPQLTKLTLYTNSICHSLPNGRQWEELITSSLPLLKIFQFCFSFDVYASITDSIHNVVASFSTPFYLLEKCWFIRCDFDNAYGFCGTLYSLPFAFPEMPINCISFDSSMSNIITDNVDETKYNSQRTIETLNVPSEEFANLLVNIPQLQSLTSTLIDLIILTEKFTNKIVCDILSKQIQSLTISPNYSADELGNVPVRHLNNIVRVFKKSCRHLSLGIAAHPNTIQPILRRMQKLHSLHISCKSWNAAQTWLIQPPTIIQECDFMYVADERNFYVWFGNRC